MKLSGEPGGSQLREAIASYRRAVERNPSASKYWTELALAYELTGELESAKKAFERARLNYPISAEISWTFGNFLLRQGQLSEAGKEIRFALETDPRLSRFAVTAGWTATRDVAFLLDHLLPPRAQFYLEAIDYLISKNELEPALRVWERLETLREPLELKRVLRFLEALLQQNRVAEAVRVWQHALDASRWPDGRAGNSLVWDGGFEQDFLNGGFGWRRLDVAGTRIDVDAEEAHSGTRSLRIRFDGSANVDLAAPQQFVAVEPRTRYRFAAWLKLDGISTDSGVSFRIFDPRNPQAVDVATQNRTGTQPWTQQEAEFTTGPETRLVLIAPRRAPSAKLDYKIRGTAWVDDVSLTPVGPAPEPPR